MSDVASIILLRVEGLPEAKAPVGIEQVPLAAQRR
jgi:hypothetical protein